MRERAPLIPTCKILGDKKSLILFAFNILNVREFARLLEESLLTAFTFSRINILHLGIYKKSNCIENTGQNQNVYFISSVL